MNLIRGVETIFLLGGDYVGKETFRKVIGFGGWGLVDDLQLIKDCELHKESKLFNQHYDNLLSGESVFVGAFTKYRMIEIPD